MIAGSPSEVEEYLGSIDEILDTKFADLPQGVHLYSYSRCSLYSECPRACKKRYIDRIPDPSGVPAQQGRFAHAAIAMYHHHLLRQGWTTDFTAMDQIADWLLRSGSTGIPIEEIPETLAMLQEWVRGYVFNPETCAGVEHAINIQVGANVWWTGVLDRYDIDHNTMIADIYDFKSDHRLRSQTELNHDPQIKAYCMTLKERFPQLQGFRMHLVPLRFPRYRPFPIEVTLAQVEETKHIILALIEAQEAETRWKETPGDRCEWCAYVLDCPAGKRRLRTEINTPEQARAIAADLITTQARAKALQGRLRTFAAENGPIDVNGMAVGYFTRESSPFVPPESRADLWRRLEAMHLNPMDYFGMNGEATKALMRDPDVASVIDPLLVTSTSTAWDTKRIRNDDQTQRGTAQTDGVA